MKKITNYQFSNFKSKNKWQVVNDKRQIQRAFTLIEMLVVISIIGILATLIAANLNSARSRARDAERKSDLKNIETALRLYYNDNNEYPVANTLPWGAKWNVGNIVYMQMLPIDPLSPNQTYQYKIGTPTDGYTSVDDFTLVACLENASDPSGVTPPSGFSCPVGSPAFVITE
jgi:type II secretion system protein G